MIHYFFLKINIFFRTEAAPRFFLLHFHLCFLTWLEAQRSVTWVSNENLARKWCVSPCHSAWPCGTLAVWSSSDVPSGPAHQLIIKHGTVLQPQVRGIGDHYDLHKHAQINKKNSIWGENKDSWTLQHSHFLANCSGRCYNYCWILGGINWRKSSATI